MAKKGFPWREVLSWALGFALLGLVGFWVYSGVKAHRARRVQALAKEVYPHIRVEVLNAAGARGLAKKVSWKLREMGFDVVFYGNAGDTLAKTVVVERADTSCRNARLVAEAIGCKEITYEPDPDLLLEVTLILGKDWRGLFKDLKEPLF